MGKRRNRGLAVIAAMGLLLSMPMAVHAAPPTATGTEASPAHVTINKHLQMPEGTITPAGTATFKFTSKTVDGAPATPTNMPALPDRTVTFVTSDAGTTTGGVKTVMKESANIVDGVTFPHAGEYIYTVKEENSGFTLTNNTDLTETMDYSTIEYQIQVIVANNAAGTGVYVQSISVNVLAAGGTVGAKVNDNDDAEGTSFAFDNKFVRTHLNDPNNPSDSNDTNLRISKKVAGDGGNLTQYFDFTTTLTAPALVTPSTPTTYKAGIMEGGALIDPTANGISGAASDHTFTVTPGTALNYKLKHGQTLVVMDAPVGAKYTNTETAVTGYTTTIAQTANGVASTPAAPTVTDVLIGEATNASVYTNTKAAITPTGIVLNNLPYIMIGVLAIGGFILLGRKKHSTN